MLCSPCRYAADTGDQAAHRMCKNCGCQHRAVGYGRPESKGLQVDETGPELDENLEPVRLRLDEASQAALDSTGMTLDELLAGERNWSLDGWGLKVLRIIRGQAA